jgi:hypothetical protein
VLEALPVTPKGKLNRRALPNPANTRPELAVAYVAPVTPVEKELSRIWTAVLALDRLCILDISNIQEQPSVRADLSFA